MKDKEFEKWWENDGKYGTVPRSKAKMIWEDAIDSFLNTFSRTFSNRFSENHESENHES